MHRYHGLGELLGPEGAKARVVLLLHKDGPDWTGTVTSHLGDVLPPWVSAAYNRCQIIRLRLPYGVEASARVAFLRRRGGQADLNGLGEPPF